MILPISGGGDTGNLATLLNPSWINNRGWQILRIDGAGQVLWQRTTRITLPSGYLSIVPNASAPTIMDAKRTAGGGLALIVQGGLIVLDAQGNAVLQLRLNAPRCGLVEFASNPDRVFLSDDDTLVLGYASDTIGASRACAVDFAGAEIESIATDAGSAMGVIDYRRNAGFLVSNFVPGSFGPTSTSLRTATTTRWSVPDVQIGAPSRSLAPNGDAWLRVDSHARIVDLSGAVRGDTDDFLFPKLWLDGGDVLIADDDSIDVRRVHGNGGAVWQESLPLFLGGSDTDWQQLPDRVRMMQVHLGNFDIRSASLGLEDGDVISDDARDFEFRQAAGLAGTDGIVTVDRGETLDGWSRPAFGCIESGYCPEAVDYAQPDVLLRAPATGATIAIVDPAQLAFPLATRLREFMPAVVPIPGTAGDAIHVQVASDGHREVVDVMRLGRSGLRAWRTSLAFERFDAATTAVAIVGGAIHVSAEARGSIANERRMWKLGLDGTIQWDIALPYAVSRLVAAGAGGVEACGPSVSAPTRWLCVTGAGAITDTAIDALASNRVRVVRREFGRMLAQTLPASGTLISRFELGLIDAAGNYAAEAPLEFDPPPFPQRLRVDAMHRSTTILATALVHGNDSGSGRPIALLVARFDRDGTRHWQRRIDTPLRAIDERIVNSLVTLDGSGDVFVSFHPYGNNVTFPTRVCRFAYDGTPGPCVDAPLQGRINALLPMTDEAGIYVWAGAMGAGTSTNHPDAMVLYRLANDTFSAPLVTVPGYRTSDAATMARSSDGQRAWFVSESSAAAVPQIDPVNATTAVISLAFTEVFVDGFE